jgi:hypothetical protein
MLLAAFRNLLWENNISSFSIRASLELFNRMLFAHLNVSHLAGGGGNVNKNNSSNIHKDSNLI